MRLRPAGDVPVSCQKRRVKRLVRTHTFSTGKFRLLFDRLHGICVYPDADAPNQPDERTIIIDPDLKGQARLETLIHESLHAENHDLTEEQVTAAGRNIARLLWRLGYREVGP